MNKISRLQKILSANSVKKAIEYFGSGTNLALKLGVYPQAVYTWKSSPENKSFIIIPVKHAIKIEKLSNGSITRKELRPDVYN